MPYPKNEKLLAEWKYFLNKALVTNETKWDRYDAQFCIVVNLYNSFLRTTPGFVALDWKIVKALTWVETGANVPEWETRPMQIGNDGDPGLHQILATASGKLLLPPSYKALLTAANVVVNGNLNIQAGVGYLLWVFAHFGYLPDAPRPRDPFPKPLSGSHPKPAHAHDHGKHSLPPPIKTRYAVTGWKPITLETVAAHYNGGGDGNYLEKLRYSFAFANGTIQPDPAQAAQAFDANPELRKAGPPLRSVKHH